MIVCIGLAPAAGSGGCRAPESGAQYGAAKVNVGGAGACSARYSRLLSPTALAKFDSTDWSSTTFHAPVFFPIALVSTAIAAPLYTSTGEFGRARDTVTPTSGFTSVFLSPGGTRKWACSTARWRSSPEP